MIRFMLIQLAVFTQIIFCQFDEKLTQFRGSPFGSSPSEVKSMETAPSLQSFSGWGIYALSYTGRFAGMQARIDYTFADDKLIEGSYILEPGDDYVDAFCLCRDKISEESGNPNSWAIAVISHDNIWHKKNDFGLYEGPQLFWIFEKGFIALHSSKFNDKITITVLFSGREGIGDYNAESLIEIKNPVITKD
jgi:hypothetical protein